MLCLQGRLDVMAERDLKRLASLQVRGPTGHASRRIRPLDGYMMLRNDKQRCSTAEEPPAALIDDTTKDTSTFVTAKIGTREHEPGKETETSWLSD